MRKKSICQFLMIGALFAIGFFLNVCNSQDPQKIISKELGIDVSSGNEMSNLDTHGGFHGDGATFIALEFSGDEALSQIKENGQWKAFPLDDTIKTLVYGISDKTSRIGPYVSDDEGNALLPDIHDGYYLLIDRHSDADKKGDIMHRGSFNFTVGIYDSNTNILYFCKLDT